MCTVYNENHRTNIVGFFLLTFDHSRDIIIKLSNEGTNGKTAGAAQEKRRERAGVTETFFEKTMEKVLTRRVKSDIILKLL